ncbi:hypothetical protein LTR70_000520 [Exophiala xenobiotica]|uniref:Uncharacterized protein n=1 Tax=Lithohypha guttulata TaxID=1690604 RepID=A0ABR0KCC9_9EURO|nr:hypothetical protein LTR24_004673 [Lithohypha guttulata]KAK5329371.1 hypothetical protein LTR70_000520 [Exophiala xenobiotica]
MTTTQPLPSQGLTAEVDEDRMQMGTSPYIQLDQEIDIELDDDRDHFIEDNSMIDDATDNMDSMQQDNLTTTHDDAMYEEAADEDLLDIEDGDDYEMDPDDQGEGSQNGNTLAVEDDFTSHSAQQQHEDSLVTLDPEEASITLEDLTQEPQEGAEKDGGDEQEVEVEAIEEEEATNTVYISPDTLTDRLPDDRLRPKKIAAESTSTNTEDPPEVLDFPQSTNPDESTDSDTAQSLRRPSGEIEQESDAQPASAAQMHINPEVYEPNEAAHQEAQDTATSPEVVDESERSTAVQLDPSPSNLHPVIVNYMDQDYSLFPPGDHEDGTTYLLPDFALASQPFEKLLVACRELIGDGLGHDDEMVLDIPTLGLHICEDSKYASQITLAQVIDTYMLLSQNEQLSKSQMAYLINSAREGKFYTAIAEEHVGSPDEEQGSEEYGDATIYYETGDVLDDQEALNNSVEIEESEKSRTHELEDDEGIEHDAGVVATEITEPVEPLGEDDAASAAPDLAVAEGSEGPLPEETSPQTPDLAEQEDDAASQSSHTVEGDHVAAVQVGSVQANDPAADQHDQLAAEEAQHDFEEEEDLFADDNRDAETALLAETANGDQSVTEVEHQNGHIPEEAEEELIEWDNEDGQLNTDSAFAPPATPSKATNGKRKLEEEEDYIIDLEDTPNAKRTRSS